MHWTAGFLEGEACFGAQRKNPYIQVSQKIREPLDKLKGLFGGSICLSHRETGSYFIWQLTGKRAAGVMMGVFQLMSERRKVVIERLLRVFAATPIHFNRSKTHCKHGHDLSTAYRSHDGRRHCRPCVERRRTAQ
jgi:hypothetical protein